VYQRPPDKFEAFLLKHLNEVASTAEVRAKALLTISRSPELANVHIGADEAGGAAADGAGGAGGGGGGGAGGSGAARGGAAGGGNNAGTGAPSDEVREFVAVSDTGKVAMPVVPPVRETNDPVVVPAGPHLVRDKHHVKVQHEIDG
jgi:hypothetical protein